MRSKIDLVAIDVGNSTIAYSAFDGKSLICSRRIENSVIPYKLNNITRYGIDNSCHNYIISSVVPHITNILVKLIKKASSLNKIYIVGKNPKLTIPMKYNAKQLGADRLVNIYGACQMCRLPVLIIDFGTAITFDYISKKGVFEGGLIVPGMKLSGEALCQRTALLPRWNKMSRVKDLVGRDTKTAILSGLLNGFGSLADGLIERFRCQYRTQFTTLATGGLANIMRPYTKLIDVVDTDHTLRSLELIYRRTIGRR